LKTSYTEVGGGRTLEKNPVIRSENRGGRVPRRVAKLKKRDKGGFRIRNKTRRNRRIGLMSVFTFRQLRIEPGIGPILH